MYLFLLSLIDSAIKLPEHVKQVRNLFMAEFLPMWVVSRENSYQASLLTMIQGYGPWKDSKPLSTGVLVA